MVKDIKTLRTIAFVGNYLPRRCGIATFTADLVEAVAAASPETSCRAVAVSDRPEGYRYLPRVQFEIDQERLSDYRLAAEYLNINQVDVVCLQHEYGIYGGEAGKHVLKLLRELRMPATATLHTVLKEPSPVQRDVLRGLADLVERVVVMSRRGAEFLRQIYGIPEEKIAFIPHGVPDVPFVDPNFHKDRFGVEGKKVVLTFGLLSPDKGLETMIEAMPEVIKKHPDTVYIILGATHPQLKAARGEDYRLSLQRRVKELGLTEHVVFHNRFVEADKLCEYLGAADVYVTPYLNEAQIVSGTLAYAVGAGKAVVSTPYWHAREMLADGRGVLTPFGDARTLAERVIQLFDNETERHAMRKRAYMFGRQMVWREVADRYLEVFSEISRAHVRGVAPKSGLDGQKAFETEPDEVKLDHLRMLTDDTGILQHAHFITPAREHGYCTDDNARALIAVVRARGCFPNDTSLTTLAIRYLSFLDYAFNEETGRFRNFMSFDRRWLEEQGSEDSHGRTMWSLGAAVAFAKSRGLIASAVNLFHRALPVVEEFTFIRSWAFTLIGIHAYLRRFSGDTSVRRMRDKLGGMLYDKYRENAAADWPWPEDNLTYANAKIPHALLLAGQWMYDSKMVETSLKSLEWLMEVQTDERGYFAPVGNDGWYRRGSRPARFDQQPIEAHASIEACLEAHNVTRKRKWLDYAQRCLNWFLGDNDLRLALYDPVTGGCRDGLHRQGVNENQGAESTLAWLLSVTALRRYERPRRAGTTDRCRAAEKERKDT